MVSPSASCLSPVRVWPWFALFSSILLLSGMLFSFEPVSEGKFKTYIELSVTGHEVKAHVSFFNLSYYSKPLPDNYPDMNQPGITEFPPEFFNPPDPSKPYSQDSFSVKRQDLANASLYYSVVLNDAQEMEVSDAGGTAICNPAGNTDEKGQTACTVDYFIHSSSVESVDAQKTCSLVKVSFNGMSVGGNDFPSSSQSVMLCPANNPALAQFGNATALVLSANPWVCFPLILVLSLLIASMYYSGRDPLSLFDITAPRLPKVRQFRVKTATAPQMMRSLTRKYQQMQSRIERDAAKALLLAIKARGREEGKSREQILKEMKDAKAQLRSVFSDFNKQMKGSKEGLTDNQLRNLNQRLVDLFGKAPSDKRALAMWRKSLEATAPFIQLYNAAHQAASATSSARGTASSMVSKKVFTPLFNTLTKASVRMEEMKGMRALGRIPIIKGIVNAPTKTLDAFAQFRASRQGAITLRRELMGGAAYSALRKAGALGTAKNILGEGSPLGKFFDWSHGWKFAAFEEKHDLRNRKFKELFDPVENLRVLAINSQNTMYQELLRQIRLSLPTKDNFLEAIRALREQAEKPGKMDETRAKELSKRLDELSRKINDGIQNNPPVGRYIDQCKALLHNSGLEGADFIKKSGKWKEWKDLERRITDIIEDKKIASQSDRLGKLYALVKQNNMEGFCAVNEYSLDKFKENEKKIVRQLLLARLEGELYRPVIWEDVRNAHKNGELESDIKKKYGFGFNEKVAFEAQMMGLRNKLLDAKGEDGLRKEVGITNLVEIRDAANKQAKAFWGDRADSFALVRHNMFGLNPTGEALTRKMRELGISVPAKDLRELELLFYRGTMAQEMRGELEAAARRQGLSADQLMGRLLADTLVFQQAYNLQNIRTSNIFFGSSDERKKAFSDPLGKNDEKYLMSFLKPHEQLEYSLQRVKFGYSNYGMDLENLFNMTRAMERATGFLLWGSARGGSHGDSTLGLLNPLCRQNAESLGILRSFYNNLTSTDSKFYDDKFAKEVGGGALKGAEYVALLGRGYNFADIKNGLGFMVSGDKRGGLPFLEYDSKMLSAYGYASDIVRKGEVRDLSALLARMADSPYINIPAGISVLIKHKDKAGNETWVYGDPLKDARVQSLYSESQRDPISRRAQEISNALAGIDKDGKYDPGSQMIKVIATHDLREVKNNPGGFFGNVTFTDRFKGAFRTGLHNIGTAFGEAYYSGTHDRGTQLEKWYSAQYQVRMALESYERAIGANMSSGKDRMRADRYSDPEKSYIKDLVSRAAEEEKQGNAEAARLLRSRVEVMEKIQAGDGTFSGTLSATWEGFKRNIFAKTAKELGDAESELYGAKLELRAIEKMHKDGSLLGKDYAELKKDAMNRINDLKSAYVDMKSDYKDYNDMARYWSSSHDNVYGTTRSIFTAFSPIAKMFDSKFVQGAKYDYYWITESGAMRDPRTATGAGFGLDYSFFVGYQTGQTVYERSRFYMTNSMWEQQMRYPLNVSLGMHKWFYPMVSQAMRDTSHYPSYLEMDSLYPGRPHDSSRLGKHDLIMPMLLAPLRRSYNTDYWRTRFQYLVDFSGAGSLIGSYLETAPGAETPSFVRKQAEKYFAPSGHYSTEARFLLSQRTLDQFLQLDRAIDKYQDARDAYNRYHEADAGSQEQHEALSTLSKYARISDRRPLGVQRGVSGSDMDEDGSRNRFMNLYVGFHENIWKPTVPGMMDNDPVSGKWRSFPQIASAVDRSAEGSRLDNLRNFNTARYDEDKGRLVYEDQFHTHSDASREVYRRESTGLLHLMKYQNEMAGYSLANVPSVMFFSPLWGAAFYHGLRNLTANTKFGSSFATGSPSEEYGVTRGSSGPFLQTFGPALTLQRTGYIVANNFREIKDSIKYYYPKTTSEREVLEEESLRQALEAHRLTKKRQVKKD